MTGVRWGEPHSGQQGRSRRSAVPFVVVQCAALPDSLVEAELFGHSRGAFTGAVQARDGLVRTAEQGTLFLDEVDSLGERFTTGLAANP